MSALASLRLGNAGKGPVRELLELATSSARIPFLAVKRRRDDTRKRERDWRGEQVGERDSQADSSCCWPLLSALLVVK